MAMTNGDLRAQALRGPWTCHTYARMISNVEWHDDEGNAVNVCAYWDDRFGALLAQAWAVPQLRELLERFLTNYDTTTQVLAPRAEIDLAHDTLWALRHEYRALLERLA